MLVVARPAARLGRFEFCVFPPLRCWRAGLRAQGIFYPQQGGYQQQARGLPTAFVGGYGKNKNRAQVFVWTAVATCLPATHELRGQAL